MAEHRAPGSGFRGWYWSPVFIVLAGLTACDAEPAPRTMKVTATAYNSLAAQTDSNPTEAAWGDHLKPGMKAIAVSRDLLKEGLGRGSRVKISGLEGEYIVLDKTNKRFTKRIDVYMGTNVRKAKAFGVQKLEISWQPKAAKK